MGNALAAPEFSRSEELSQRTSQSGVEPLTGHRSDQLKQSLIAGAAEEAGAPEEEEEPPPLDREARRVSMMDPQGTPPDYEPTFRAMTYRRMERQYHGTHKPSKVVFAFWSVAFLALIVGFGTLSLDGNFQLNISFGTATAGTLVPLALLYIALRVIIVVRWCVVSPWSAHDRP